MMSSPPLNKVDFGMGSTKITPGMGGGAVTVYGIGVFGEPVKGTTGVMRPTFGATALGSMAAGVLSVEAPFMYVCGGLIGGPPASAIEGRKSKAGKVNLSTMISWVMGSQYAPFPA